MDWNANKRMLSDLEKPQLFSFCGFGMYTSKAGKQIEVINLEANGSFMIPVFKIGVANKTIPEARSFKGNVNVIPHTLPNKDLVYELEFLA